MSDDVLNMPLDVTAQEQLRDFVRRIERLRNEQFKIAEDLKGLYKDVAYSGFDVKIVREVIKRRSSDKREIEKDEELIALYLHAIES